MIKKMELMKKKNKEIYNQLFDNHKLNTLNKQIQKLQHYQYKYLKKSYRINDILNHLRNHTCPQDIYNMIKEHKVLINSEYFTNIFKNFDNLDKFNKYVDLYLN